MVADFDGAIGKRSYATWLRLWIACHESGMTGPVLRAWPDGRSLLEQPALLVHVFDIIAGQAAAEAKQKNG